MAAAFFHRDPVHLDEFVDHARRRGARTRDHRGADTEAVDRISAQRRDGVFVHVTGHHDLGSGSTECVELAPYLPGQFAEIAGVDAYRAQFGPGGRDRIGHPVVHVIGVDQQRCAHPECGDLGAKRRLLPLVGRSVGVGVQHREGVRGGTQRRNVVAGRRSQIGTAGEARDIGGPGGGDGGLLMGAPGAHFNQRAAVGRTDHPGCGRGHRTVVVEHRQRDGLE